MASLKEIRQAITADMQADGLSNSVHEYRANFDQAFRLVDWQTTLYTKRERVETVTRLPVSPNH